MELNLKHVLELKKSKYNCIFKDLLQFLYCCLFYDSEHVFHYRDINIQTISVNGIYATLTTSNTDNENYAKVINPAQPTFCLISFPCFALSPSIPGLDSQQPEQQH